MVEAARHTIYQSWASTICAMHCCMANLSEISAKLSEQANASRLRQINAGITNQGVV